MPGINLTGAPNTRDYVLGSGILRFGKNDPATGFPDADGLRDLGNATEFTVTQTTEDLKHQNSRGCVRFTDKRFVLSQEVGLSFQLDETRNFDNLALFFSGDTSVYANPHSVAITDVVQATAVKRGNWYEMRNAAGGRLYNMDAVGLAYVLEKVDSTDEVNTITAAGTPATAGSFTLTVEGQTTAAIVFNATAAQVLNALLALSNVSAGDVTAVDSGPGANLGTAAHVVTLTWSGDYADTDVTISATFTGLTGTPHVFATGTAGGGTPADVTLVVNVDYEIVEEMGIFRILPTSILAFDGSVIKLTISTGAATQQDLDQVDALTATSVIGTLLFEQNNTGDCDQLVEYRFHQVSLSPDGDMPLIGQEVAVMGFSGVAEINSFITDPSQVLTIRTYDMN